MKSPTEWSYNPAAEVNEYLYDSAIDTYDSDAQTYDGIVDGEGARDINATSWAKDRSKDPATWSSENQPKTPSAWSDAT